MNHPPLFSMRNIQKIYRTDIIETHALRQLNLDIYPGEFVAITGPSGSGKTTFLSIAGLLEPATQGIYQLGGKNTQYLSDAAQSQLRGEKIGFVFQSFNLISDLNVWDNVDVPLRYRGMAKKVRTERIAQALQQVGLFARAKHFPAQLSGGQQQRVAIARAIAGSPELILADEPTGNLDSQMAQHIMELLISLHQAGTTLVMVTHDAQLAKRAQRQIHIVDGQIAYEMPTPQPLYPV